MLQWRKGQDAADLAGRRQAGPEAGTADADTRSIQPATRADRVRRRRRCGDAERAAARGGRLGRDAVRELGRLAGIAQVQEQGRQANENPPKLRTHDRFGNRVDEVEFHPAWHELMTVAVRHGLHAAPWRDPRPGAHVARAAGFYVWGMADAGHCCPVSMTYAVVPALRHAPALAARFEPLLAAPEYDFGLRPPETKRGLLAGMSMTEKQGGSDVRANTTRAVPAGAGEYLLTGHKWFTSAPMGDLFMVLAQAPGGLSCFLLPRVRPDGTRNGMRLQRLKDKLGNRSNASAEVEYDEALAWLVGEEGRGVRTIIEMVNVTRLDCVLGTATGMRGGVPPPGPGGDQVLGVQARPRARRRGPGVPGRQWLRRGVRDAAAVPRGAAGLHLGGLGQRCRARRAPRPDQAAGDGRGSLRRTRPGGGGRPPPGPGGGQPA